MKKTFLLSSFLFLAGISSHAQEIVRVSTANAAVRAAVGNWAQSEHHFGSIPQGKPVAATFTFTNTGSLPLIISRVQGSCGCTATDYSKEPVAPGKTGFVKATYNAAVAGAFHKTVTVYTNSEKGPVTLAITGEVQPQ